MTNKTERFLKKTLEKLVKLDKKQLIELSKDLMYERALSSHILDNLSVAIIVYQFQSVVYTNEQYNTLSTEIPILPTHILQEGDQVAKDIYKNNRFINIKTQTVNDFKIIYIRDKSQEITQQLDQKTRQGLDALENLAAGISHEIKNPLSAIDLHTQILQKNILSGKLKVSEEITQYLSVVQKESTRLLEVLETFLSMTRHHKPNLVFTEISEVVENAQEIFKEELDQKGILLNITEEKVPKIFTSPALLQQIILDLVRNAMEAVEEQEEKIITINIQQSDTKNDIIISIEDTGCGIPSDIKNKIFEPYFSTKFYGTGLGLTLVNKMVKELGGWVFVENTQSHQGARFDVYLPISQDFQKLLEN